MPAPANRVPGDEPRSQELEAAVDAAIAACDGDPRAAVAALIVALSFAEEAADRAAEAISPGYVRRRPPRGQ